MDGSRAGLLAPPRLRRLVDQPFRERMRLGEPEPVVVAKGEVHVRPLEVLDRRDDVQNGEFSHPVGIVQGDAVRQPRTAVVPGQHERIETEVVHHRHHVARHLDLGIRRMIRRRRRLERKAVAAQVRADHGEALRQGWRDKVPHRVRLRVAVQQQQRRARAAMAQSDRSARHRHMGQGKAFEEHRLLPVDGALVGLYVEP